MGAFDLVLFGVKSFALSHLVSIALVIGVPLLVLAIVFLGAGPLVLAFLRSRLGQLVVALVLAGTAGWELKGYVDDSVALRRQLAAERREADKALAAEVLRTRAAEQRADEARRQAEAQHAVATAAAVRESAARDDADTLQEQVDDLNDTLAARPQPRCALSGDDARRLRGIGAAAAPRRP